MLVEKMKELREQHAVNEKKINELFNAQVRIEGAYAAIMELGIEQGVLDENGNPVLKTEDEPCQDEE